MAEAQTILHGVARWRARHGWSQAELSRRAGIPRTTVSAIEGNRLTPSVTAGLALARALECSVEELFGDGENTASTRDPAWAWMPRAEPCRFWEAEVGGRRLLYPVEALSLNSVPHDGVCQGGIVREAAVTAAETTLVVASCDPAAGFLAAEYGRAHGFRLLVLPRGGGEALDLLKRGLVHAAGLHRSTPEEPERNLKTARAELGDGFCLVRVAQWQEGLALPSNGSARSVRSVIKSARRWALREAGSAARECLDELFDGAGTTGRIVRSHAAVAEAVRGGWADAGVCVRLAAEEALLDFLPVRTELLDLCFANSMSRDRRILALIRLLRSRPHRRLLSELPGYDARETGDLFKI